MAWTIAKLLTVWYDMYKVNFMTIKQLRIEKGLTQAQCAEFLGVPMRTYTRYENDEGRAGTIKYNYMFEKLQKYGYIDEEHGLLTLDMIRSISVPIFEEYKSEAKRS